MGEGSIVESQELAQVRASQRAEVITPNDGADLPHVTTEIYVGVAGDVKVDMELGGSAIVFKAAPVGMLHIAAKRVYSTGTTATNLVALF